MTRQDGSAGVACELCNGSGEVREYYDDVEICAICECRGGPPAGLKPVPLGLPVADPTRMRRIFDALVAEPGDGNLFCLRLQVARAMATAANHPYLCGVPRLIDAGMILDDYHRSDLLSNFRDSRPDLTNRP